MPKKAATFEVEKIVSSKMQGKKEVFQVKWKGYPASQNTWEPVTNLSAVKDMVVAFKKPAAKASPKRKEPEPPAKKASPKPAEKPAKRAKTAGTRAMMTKPKRDIASKRPAPAPSQAPAPAKKQKTSPAPKAKPAEAKSPFIDVKALATGLYHFITGKKPEKPVKVKAPPKAKATKPEAQVVEVDKILGVKPAKKGGLMYEILWKDGSKSWEPEENLMDDDLIDEFEESAQAMAYAGHDIKAGSEVEVKNVDDGFENSWSSAVVKKKQGAKFHVEFTGFVDDKGTAITDSIARKLLRLVPDAPSKGWTPVVGEIIEVNEDDCWWEARVEKIDGKKVSLKYRVSDEVKPATLGTKKLRPCSWLSLKK